MSKMMYIARRSNGGTFISANNITESDLELQSAYTKVRGIAEKKNVLCNEQAPFICISCKKPVYIRKETKRMGRDVGSCFCHYIGDTDHCTGKVRRNTLKRVFVQMFYDNISSYSGKGDLISEDSFGYCMDLPVGNILTTLNTGTVSFNHSYINGINFSDWGIRLYGFSPEKDKYSEIVSEVKADITLVSDDEYIFFNIGEFKYDTSKLIEKGIYCTAFSINLEPDIKIGDLTSFLTMLKNGGRDNHGNNYVELVMSPQLYFYNKSKFFADKNCEVICPASNGEYVVNTNNCENCPCCISSNDNEIRCLGRTALISGAYLLKAGLFKKFTKEEIQNRFEAHIKDVTSQEPRVPRINRTHSFGMCPNCGRDMVIAKGCRVNSSIKMYEVDIDENALFLTCKDCGHTDKLRCACGHAIVPYINESKGSVFIGCANRSFSKNGFGSCNSGTLTIFTDVSCTTAADELLEVNDIRLWVNGNKNVLDRLEGLRNRYRG